MMGAKQMVSSKIKYDKREEFFLPDGGLVHLDFKGESFANIEKLTAAIKTETEREIIHEIEESLVDNRSAPILIVIPNLFDDSQSISV
jgi:uncharacterized protein (UPF0261 family)